MNRKITFERASHILIIVGIIWSLVLVLDHLSDVLLPFVIGLVIAYFLNPITNKIQNFIKLRALAAVVTLVFIVFTTILIFMLIIPLVGNELSEMGRTVSKMATDTEFTKAARERLPENVWAEINDFLKQNDVKRYLTSDGAIKMLKDTGSKIMPGVWRVIYGATNVLLSIIGLLIIMLYVVFILIDYQKITDSWQNYLPSSMHSHLSNFMQEFIRSTNLYFRSQALIAFSVSLLFIAGFTIIELPLAILMGMFIGLLNMVPYLAILGILPCLFLAGINALEQGDNFFGSLGLVLIVFGLIQIIQEILLVPRIQGKAMGLSPAIILLSVSVWGKLLGFLGIIMALPLTCLGLSYYRSFLWTKPSEIDLKEEKE